MATRAVRPTSETINMYLNVGTQVGNNLETLLRKEIDDSIFSESGNPAQICNILYILYLVKKMIRNKKSIQKYVFQDLLINNKFKETKNKGIKQIILPYTNTQMSK